MPTPTRRIEAELAALFPAVGPWTRAALSTGFEERPVPDTSIDGELPGLLTHKLGPFLQQWARTNGVVLPTDVAQVVQRHTFLATMRARQSAHAANELIAQLGARGVESVVVKGPGIAAHYARPDTRTFGDVDLLVRPHDFRATRRYLHGQGWTEPELTRQPWSGLDRWSRESVNLYRDLCVDLHHRLSPWLWSTGLPTADLIDRAVAVPVGPITLPCLAGPDNLVAAALQLINDHAAPGSKLLAWRDLAELGRTLPSAATAEHLDACGLAGLFAPLLSSLPASMRPHGLIEALPRRAVPHPLRTYAMFRAAEQNRVGVNHLLRLPVLGAAMYVGGHVVPSRAYVRQRYPELDFPYLHWWRNALSIDGGHQATTPR